MNRAVENRVIVCGFIYSHVTTTTTTTKTLEFSCWLHNLTEGWKWGKNRGKENKGFSCIGSLIPNCWLFEVLAEDDLLDLWIGKWVTHYNVWNLDDVEQVAINGLV